MVVITSNCSLTVQSKSGRYESVKFLLSDKRVDPSHCNPNKFTNYPIVLASVNGHLKIVQELLKDDRVDPSVDNNYAVIWANKHKHTEVVEELKKHPKVQRLLDSSTVPLPTVRPSGDLEAIGWHGDISREDAISILRGRPVGSFLMRWSHNARSYVMSVVTWKGIEQLADIVPVDGKIQVIRQNGAKSYFNNLFEYVDAMIYIRVARYPVTPDPELGYGRCPENTETLPFYHPNYNCK